jgi:hypothetical protein
MTWKKLNNLHFGGTDVFGGADIDKISQLFDGTQDIEEVDMNTNFPVRSGKFKFRNPANTFSYNVTPSAISANRTVTLPVLNDTDDFLFENTPETIENKTLSGCAFSSPTITNLGSLPHITYPSERRWGAFQPHGSGNGQFDGIIAGHTALGASSSYVYSASTGYALRVTTGTTDGNTAGLQAPTAQQPFRTAKAGKVLAKLRPVESGSWSFLMGLVDWTTIPPSGAIVPDGAALVSNIGLGGTFMYRTGGSSNPVIGPALNNSTTHIIEMSWDTGGSTMYGRVDGGSLVPVTSGLPSSTTPFYFQIVLRTDTNSARSLDIYGIWIETE